ncbi:MAG: IclR family transcriptional regulator [Spirochaetes bacterium]|jgi:DNA-binding IclR family transcriptional regulator|nr:IclR family transcriptional regulator [Spirochaetota bacterium]
MGATIQSLERGLEIVGVIARAGRPLSLTEISESFSIDRSSVFRLLSTLAKHSFVLQDPDTKRYSLGYRMLEYAGLYGEQSHLESLIRPIMRRVLASTKQNTHLAILDGAEVVFVAVEQPRESISLNLSVGMREPSTVTALGRALLAFSDADSVTVALSAADYRRYTEKSPRSAKEVMRSLDSVRARRLAIDDGEYKKGIVCFASPVLNHRKEALFSIGISGPADLIRPQADSFAEIVRQAGIDASLLLGYSR